MDGHIRTGTPVLVEQIVELEDPVTAHRCPTFTAPAEVAEVAFVEEPDPDLAGSGRRDMLDAVAQCPAALQASTFAEDECVVLGPPGRHCDRATCWT
jgi:hypothetical protein